MLKMNDIKNLLQHNKITEFVKLNKLTPKDIAEFANRNTKWAGKLFQNLDPKHAAKAFKLLQNEQQEEVIKALPEAKAAELLKSTEQAISTIALTVGFADQSHFSNSFRQLAGLTPAQFRRAHR